MLPVPGLRATGLRQLLTQHQLSERSGVSRPAIHRIEGGQPAWLNTIRKLADALQVEPDELLRELGQGEEVATA